MSIMEAARAAIKLEDTANTMKRFYKEEYEEKIKVYKDLLRKVIQANNENPVQALLRMSRTQTYQDSGLARALFISATHDLLLEDKKVQP